MEHSNCAHFVWQWMGKRNFPLLIHTSSTAQMAQLGSSTSTQILPKRQILLRRRVNQKLNERLQFVAVQVTCSGLYRRRSLTWWHLFWHTFSPWADPTVDAILPNTSMCSADGWWQDPLNCSWCQDDYDMEYAVEWNNSRWDRCLEKPYKLHNNTENCHDSITFFGTFMHPKGLSKRTSFCINGATVAATVIVMTSTVRRVQGYAFWIERVSLRSSYTHKRSWSSVSDWSVE